MSGIVGICEPGAILDRGQIASMMAALSLPGEDPPRSLGSRSAAFGVAPRWSSQQLTEIPGVRIALDADLRNVSDLVGDVSGTDPVAREMNGAEVIARLYLKHGLSFVDRLEGSFAIALWDEYTHRCVLALDRLGIKTLYWSLQGPRLLFGTRAGAVRAAFDGPAEVSTEALVQFLLCSAVPAPLCIYRGIEKVRPGFLLVFEKGRVRHRPYWDLEYPESEKQDERYWAQAVRDQLRAAVHRHVEDCAPEMVGAYLSGGTDSSSVVAFMNERHSPVKTFCAAFTEEQYSEISFALATAERFQATQHVCWVSPPDALEAIPKLARYYDEPFGNSSAIGAYYCARTARQSGVELLLAGDGGDEIFAGNSRYAYDKIFQLYNSLPRWLRKGVIEPAAALLPPNDGRLSFPRRFLRRAAIPNPRRICSYGPYLSMSPEEVFDPEVLSQVPPSSWLTIPETHFRSARASSELNRHLYLDVKMTLADNDLRKVAGTAEMAGVGVRFPLLDCRLVEFAARIPTHLKLRGFKKRYIFKEAMKGILPERVLHKKKHGFGVPLALWLLNDPKLHALMRDVLNDRRTRQRGYLRPEFFDRLQALHREVHAAFFGESLWHLMVLELWHREHLEGAPRAQEKTGAGPKA